MSAGEVDQIALDAADVAQPQHGAAADGAARDFQRTARKGGQCHDEAAALAAQIGNRLFNMLGGDRLQPGAEGQHPLRAMSGDDQRRIAKDFRFIVGGGPGDQHLRVRQQKLLEAIGLGLQRHRVVSPAAIVATGLAAIADQHDGGEDGEPSRAGQHSEAHDLLAVEVSEGAAERLRVGGRRTVRGGARRHAGARQWVRGAEGRALRCSGLVI